MGENTAAGPLTGIQALESTAFRMGQFARRLLADHRNDELNVTDAHVFAHDDGDTSCELTLQAGDADKARAVAAALGMEAHSEFSDHGLVMESVRGRTKLDGMTVVLRGYRHLTHEESAAWRARQDQAAAEDTAGAA